jgi:hypothetical protein
MYMNNAGFFDGRDYPKRLIWAYQKWLELTGTTKCDDSFAEFAARPASSAFKYEVGEIVQFKQDDKLRYGKITKYETRGEYNTKDFNAIVVSYPNDGGYEMIRTLAVSDDPAYAGEFKASIPKDLLNLAKAEILKDIKCPFAQKEED